MEGNNGGAIQPHSVEKKVPKGGQIGTDEKKPSVLYIGHIPHGFYEDQMRGKECILYKGKWFFVLIGWSLIIVFVWLVIDI